MQGISPRRGRGRGRDLIHYEKSNYTNGCAWKW